MDTQFSDDLNTIRADDYTEKPEGFENLETPEEVAEFEAWLCEIDRAYDESMDGDHESALESVYGPND